MDTETLTIVMCLMLLGVLVLMALLLPGRGQKVPNNATHLRLEFTKQIMLILLSMWVLGGLVGIWVVVFCDYTYIEKLQGYVSFPVTAGIGCYTAKAGAENLKKSSCFKEPVEDVIDERGQDF